MRTTWTGCGTALVTPFTTDGVIDEPAIRRLARRQIDAGMHFLVPCGTTGESPTLSREEKRRVVELVVAEAAGKVPVLAGAGGYDTHEVIEAVQEMAAAGAQGILSVTPYYNKPTQEGLYQHYRAIAASTPLPIVVYNVPGRTGCNVEPATLVRLAAINNIVAVKEASGNPAQIADVIKDAPDDFSVLSGDDELTVPILALGGDGLISVVSNVIPRRMAELVRLGRAGDLSGARALHLELLPWLRAAFLESNPIPVKAALAMMGRFENVLRSPLVPLDERHESSVRDALQRVGAL